VEYELGSFYITGGIYRLVKALENLARGLGVEIYCDSLVDRIIHADHRAMGIHVNGEVVQSDAVVCNGDVVTSYHSMISGYEQYKKKLIRLEPSLSGVVFLWSVKGIHPQFGHHNIMFSRDYREEFRQIFTLKRAPSDPTIYISITCKTDSHDAPPGGENWFVLVNAPCLHEGQNWPEEVDRLRETILSRLKKLGIDIRMKIEQERVLTPDHMAELYLSNRGSIYGISSNNRSAAFRRPPNRDRQIKGLYFAGGSSHPGGGVPLVMLSGRLTAHLIAARQFRRT
jgi:phytoene desaturase